MYNGFEKVKRITRTRAKRFDEYRDVKSFKTCVLCNKEIDNSFKDSVCLLCNDKISVAHIDSNIKNGVEQNE